MSRWNSCSYSGINSLSDIEKALEAAVDPKLSVRHQCQIKLWQSVRFVLSEVEMELEGCAEPCRALARSREGACAHEAMTLQENSGPDGHHPQ